MLSSPPPSPTRPLAGWHAVAWTFVATFAFLFVFSMVASARSGAEHDPISGVLAQVVGYGLTLFFILRVHAPDASILGFVGGRGTSTWLLLLGPLLGIAATFPANALHEAIARRHPFEESIGIVEIWSLASPGGRALLALAIAFVGPVVEEVFFRGALFGGVSRTIGRYGALALTTLLFTLVHVRWQSFAPIFLVGLLLGVLRITSGSIGPSILAHMAFNGVGVFELARSREIQPDAALTIGGSVATLTLIAGAVWVGRTSEPARAAREEET